MPTTPMTDIHGNIGRDQFIVTGPHFMAYKSHKTVIAKITTEFNERIVYLDREKWNHSKTVSKYRDVFLGETKAETEEKIKSGKYRMINLNG